MSESETAEQTRRRFTKAIPAALASSWAFASTAKAVSVSHVFAAADTTLRWHFAEDGSYDDGQLSGNVLYSTAVTPGSEYHFWGDGGAGIVYCFEYATTNDVGAAYVRDDGSAVYGLEVEDSGEYIYGGTDSGWIRKLSVPNLNGEWQIERSVGIQTIATNVSEGYIYVGDVNGNINILDPSDGSEIDSFDAKGVKDIDTAPSNDRFYAVGSDGFLQAYDAGGTFLWETDLGQPLHSVSYNSYNGNFYVGAIDEVMALDSSGDKIWTSTTPSGDIHGVEADPDGTSLYVGDEGNGNLYAIDQEKGFDIWNVNAYGPVYDIDISKPTEVLTPTPEPPDPESNEGLFRLWDNNLAVLSAVVGAFAFLGAWSKSLTVAAWGAYLSFLYLAFESEIGLWENIGLVTLVLVMVGFAFKFYRSEMV